VTVRLQLVARTGHPDFLDLPWPLPLEDWDHERLVEVTRGISRHVVRFVNYDGAIYALKELPGRVAAREYGLLRHMAAESIPVVDAVGVVTARGDDLQDVLITRHLDYSLPYRLVLARRPVAALRERLAEAVADLLVRLHLSGFFWGDCSLSNTLFRRDAGRLAAYVVDVETGELHEELSPGQREHDVSNAMNNLAGELYDLQAEHGSDGFGDPEELAFLVGDTYERLWNELTTEEEFSLSERSRLAERLRRLNERGFDVEEVELARTDGGYRLTVKPHLVDPGHYRRRLLRLTGLSAQENQARRLLDDLEAFRAALERAGQPPVSDAALAGRWLTQVFEPAIASVPHELWGKRQAAQLYHEVLEHRDAMSSDAGREVPIADAFASYVDTVLRALPDERVVTALPLNPT
jgi:hypothetical protein